MQFLQQMLYSVSAKLDMMEARIEARITALSDASIERNKGIHKRVDGLEERLWEIASKQIQPSKIGLLKVLGLLAAHWQIIIMGLLMLLGAMGVLKPDTIKALKSFIKGLAE